ncbi:hypothetical protein [Paenibacillus ginsengarvi]|uniref:hypothetical protein n=1 Tax=Paenibacillus ginsengarvi TaxID=400777 RepID=UPI0013153236|nr:hypothetical protein [Paenibacillus ginsengarvi]
MSMYIAATSKELTRAADRMLWRIANSSLPYEHIRIQGELRIGRTTAVNRRE